MHLLVFSKFWHCGKTPLCLLHLNVCLTHNDPPPVATCWSTWVWSTYIYNGWFDTHVLFPCNIPLSREILEDTCSSHPPSVMRVCYCPLWICGCGGWPPYWVTLQWREWDLEREHWIYLGRGSLVSSQTTAQPEFLYISLLLSIVVTKGNPEQTLQLHSPVCDFKNNWFGRSCHWARIVSHWLSYRWLFWRRPLNRFNLLSFAVSPVLPAETPFGS